MNQTNNLIVQTPEIAYISAEKVKISCFKDTRLYSEGFLEIYVDGKNQTATCELYLPGILNNDYFCFKKSFELDLKEKFQMINQSVSVECKQIKDETLKEKSSYKLFKLCNNYID